MRSVGDTVRIVPESVIRSWDGSTDELIDIWVSQECVFVTETMLQYCEREAVITDVLLAGVYRIDIDRGTFAWPESCFDDIVDYADFDGLEGLL